MALIELRGKSGRVHRFSAHRPDETFPAAPAVYSFARPAPGGIGFQPLFLSRTGNLRARLASHEMWAEARLLGATHILMHQREERDAREMVEADLVAALKPVMNAPLIDAEAVHAEIGGEVIEADFEIVANAPPRLVWAA